MRAEYIDHMGSDLTVVNAARVSFDKISEFETMDAVPEFGDWGGPLNEARIKAEGWQLLPSSSTLRRLKTGDQKLIKYLATHNHWTPFSHVQITLRETVPIFVARQRFKHMVGFTYNEESRRYIDSDPTFFLPDAWRGRAANKKQGSSEEIVKDLAIDFFLLDSLDITEQVKHHFDVSERLYKQMLADGIAPEQARMVLPQAMYTSYYVTGSLAAWARAYSLRIDAHAQKEIQDLAIEWGKVIQPICPVSWEALCPVAS